VGEKRRSGQSPSIKGIKGTRNATGVQNYLYSGKEENVLAEEQPMEGKRVVRGTLGRMENGVPPGMFGKKTQITYRYSP